MLNVPLHWRIAPSASDLSPFGAGEHTRPLRIVVDDATTPPGAALTLLREFERRPGVEVYSTDAAAPQRIEIADRPAPNDIFEVRYVLPHGTRVAALGAARSWQQHARHTEDEYRIDAAEARRGLLLAQAAARHQVDALVTSMPVLGLPRWRHHAVKGNVMASEEACALLGLFLRAHNDLTVRVDGNHSTFVEFERFYLGAATAALPSYLDWLHVVWTLWRDGRGPQPFELLRAVPTRIGRALVARDYVSVRVRHWQPEETWGEVLYFFESFLLSLHGAIDAFARLLNVALRLSNDVRRAGFQHRRWRTKLVARASSPRLAELLAPEAPFVAAVESIGVLRNFIHAEALSAELLRDDDGPSSIDYGKGVLALHGRSAEQLVAATGRAGGSTLWGLLDGHAGAITVMPLTFLREALERTLACLEAIMATQILASTVRELARPFDHEFWISTHQHSAAFLLLTGLRRSDASASNR